MKTDQEIINEALDLAREFYRLMGYVQADGYKFYEATHPQEIMCWNMAIVAFDIIGATDLLDVLDSVLESQS